MAHTKLSKTQAARLLMRDNQGRYYAPKNGPARIPLSEYLLPYRPPSVRYPYAYLDALQTYKFSAWLQAYHPELAVRLGLLGESDDWSLQQGARLLTKAVEAWNDGPPIFEGEKP